MISWLLDDPNFLAFESPPPPPPLPIPPPRGMGP